jgi:8-oxo-dGTP diphosphatase
MSRIPVSVDIALFRLAAHGLEVLVVQRAERKNEPFPKQWSLIGGAVDTVEDPDLLSAAHRILLQRTGSIVPYLDQVVTAGSATRDPRGWSETTLYLGLVASDFGADLKPGVDILSVAWLPLTNATLRALAFDHTSLLLAAVERLRAKVNYSVLPGYLLPDTFTLSELREVYECILGCPIENSKFRKKMAEFGGLEKTGELRKCSNRPPELYRLKPDAARVLFPENLV